MGDIRTSGLGGTPFGDTSSRPLSPQIGQTYYNGTLGYLEIYTSAGWIPATGANDFSLNLTGAHTSITLNQSYSSGSYSIVSASNDVTIDVYAYDTDGSLAGYSNTKSFTATQRFNKIIVIGGSTGDVLSFSYKTTYATNTSTTDITSGAYITSISTSSMPNVDSTTTITGGNFANDVQVYFSSTGYNSTAAKSIVRSSSTSLIVTRPDNFPISLSPYTVTIINPSVSNQPTGSSSHISSNSITAGVSPVWVTNNQLVMYINSSSNTITLQATDQDANSTITYSYVSGTLPSGTTFNAGNATITGVPASSGTSTYTVRATDAGGNFVDRTFTITAGELGLSSSLPAASPKFLKSVGMTQSGAYWFKNAGYNSGNAFQAYADLSVGDGYIITSGYAISNDSATSWSQFGTEATSNSGTPGFRNNFYTSNSILTGWSGDTDNKFILGQTSNNGSDINSATSKNWFVLNLSPSVAKTWFDNNLAASEFQGTVIASSSGSGLTDYSWSSGHGDSIWQMFRTSGGGVNSRLWMETKTGGTDLNHAAIVFSTGEGAYLKGNADNGSFPSMPSYRWVFMGFSPSNMSVA